MAGERCATGSDDMMTEQQFMSRFAQAEPLPADFHTRLVSLVHGQLRRQRVARRVRRVVVVAIAAVLVSLASGAQAQVKCDECHMVWMPIVHNAPVDVDAATRFWGG